MSEERHDVVIRGLDTRLTKIEVLLEERNRKSDEMMAKIVAIDAKLDEKFDRVSSEYISRREFDEYKRGISNTDEANGNGIKAWQAVVFALIMLGLSAGLNFLTSRI